MQTEKTPSVLSDSDLEFIRSLLPTHFTIVATYNAQKAEIRCWSSKGIIDPERGEPDHLRWRIILDQLKEYFADNYINTFSSSNAFGGNLNGQMWNMDAHTDFTIILKRNGN